MSKFRSLIAIILSVVMLICILPTTVSAAHFSDVPSSIGEMYLDAINYVTDNGIMNGVSSTSFSPNAAITRADFMIILYRVSGDTGTYTNASQFTDVPSSSYYFNAVSWAVNKGIAGGVTSTTFMPLRTVTRQEMMTFFYRFANSLGYSTETDEDLTQAADYSSLYSYAYTPMSWAYEYGIVSRASLTERIWPTALEDRKDAALFTARFIRNVVGVVYGKSTFTFQNTSSAFVSGKNETTYLMSADDWSTLSQAILNENSNFDLQALQNKEWKGSCFGMSVAMVLDYLGKIDLNGSCCNNTSTLGEIPSLVNWSNPKHKSVTATGSNPLTITQVESKINFYQQSWSIPSINDWVLYIDRDTGLRDIVAKLDHSGIGVFSYLFIREGEWKGHSVVAYGKPIVTDYGYKIAVSDNRCPSETSWLQITTSSSGWTAVLVSSNIRNVISRCKFQSNFSMYNSFDFDGYDNASVASTNQLSNYVMLEVCATGDFTIANGSGETFTVSENGNLSARNSMNVIGQNFIPSGEDEPVTFLFLVEPSQTYTCSAESGAQVVSFEAVAGEACYNGAQSSSVANEDGGITIVLEQPEQTD